jgi:Zn finger protein HypA/HybF involved in hydrogenase expression
MMCDPRIILCENCQSEGRIYRGQFEDERDCGECPVCDGTGSVVIETESIEIDDLE